MLKPRWIVESGCENGFTAAHMALGCKHNGFGMVTTLEISPDQAEAARQNIRREQLSEWCSVVAMNASDYIRSIPEGRGPELALIDTLIPLRMAEVTLLAPRMKSGSIIAVHDVSILHPCRDGHELLRELHQFSRDDGWELMSLPSPRGLAILQKI